MFFSRRWAVELSHMDGLEDDIPSQINHTSAGSLAIQKLQLKLPAPALQDSTTQRGCVGRPTCDLEPAASSRSGWSTAQSVERLLICQKPFQLEPQSHRAKPLNTSQC